MIADRETFADLTVHLKRASDALLKAVRHVTLFSPDAESEERWPAALDELVTMAIELATMERILRALMDANDEETRAIAQRLHASRS